MRVQCCGDAHLLNFGGFTSPERSMLFDVNDFDETLPGPWEWDVKRLAASIEVAGRDGQLKPVDRRNAVEATARQYREAMRDFATLTELGVWYSRLDGDSLVALVRAEVGAKEAPNLEANLAKARSKDSMKAFTKLTQLLDGQPIITPDPPLIVPLRDLIEPEVLPKFQDELHKLFRAYRARSKPTGAACSSSTGSWIWLGKWSAWAASGRVAGSCCSWAGATPTRYSSRSKRPKNSVLAPFCGKSKISNQGQRVVEGQRLMQAASDITLGWLRTVGLDGRQRDFYIRQLWDGKVGVEPATLTPATLAVYGRICGWTLARAHARSGDRIAIASYLGAATALRHRDV